MAADSNARRMSLLGLTVALGLLSLALLVAPAQGAGLKLVDGAFRVDSFKQNGVEQELQAGAHPASASNSFELELADEGTVSGHLRDVRVNLPVGFVGYPEDTPKCSLSRFLALANEYGQPLPGRPRTLCPSASQVGIVDLSAKGASGESPVSINRLALYSLTPREGVLAEFGFIESSVPVIFSVRLDPVTYGLVGESIDSSTDANAVGAKVFIWGVPADSSHDQDRSACGSSAPSIFDPPCPVSVPRVPFLSNPASCGPTSAFLRVNSWEQPSVFQSASFVSEDPIAGCDRLQFEPSFEATPTSRSTGSASGFTVHLDLPQNEDPDSIGTPPLRTARVVLPEGMTINSASAGGLGACTDAQLGLGTDSPNACPNDAKLGTVVAKSPALANPIEGSVYLRSQASKDPESGEMFRMALVLEDKERGLLIKQAGQVKINKGTGRIETIFADNPQLPVSSIDLNLKAGPRAALQMPKTCGTYATDYTLTSWGGQSVSGQSRFKVDQDCTAAKFDPTLEAGSANPVAGESSPFILRLTRADGQPNVAAIEATLPQGLLAKLKGVPYCPEAQAATGNCPAASQIGTTTVGAGVGTSPVYVPQPGKAPTAVYLAGPYRGAPLSIVAKVPAQAGPFDLGTVAVRNALQIDPSTAQVTAKSDPLPQILGGVPISYRDIRVEMSRPDFTLNPTSCEQMAVTSKISAVTGVSASPSSRFQVANCAELAFKPKLALALSGAPTRRGGFPALKATLTMPKASANIARAQVTLPKTEILEQAHIRTICTRVQYAAENCPKASIYGYAKAWSPLLDKPLQGPVYLRSSSNPLPDLVASLDGQIHIDLAGRIDSVNARIRNTFQLVPDAPVSKFVLTMQGGKKGLLVNNTDLCKAKPRASASFDGQNGKVSDSNPLVRVAGCKGKSRK